MRKYSLVIILLLVFAIAAFPGDQARKRKPMAGPSKIGFSEAYNPSAGFTLAGNFSKLKTYLENEFGATVSAEAGSWGNIAQYDLFIIPGRFWTECPGSVISQLQAYVQSGGVLLVLWHPLTLPQVYIDPDRNWGGENLRKFMEQVGKVWYTASGSVRNIDSISAPYSNNPYVANFVNCAGGISPVNGGTFDGTPVVFARAGGVPNCFYNASIGSGKVYFVGNVYCFQDSYIDTSDNLDFLYNIIHNAFGNGGGGGTGKSNLAVMKVKAKNYLASPGDTILFKVRVKNKSTEPTDACKVGIYLSPDKVWDASDIKLGEGDVPALGKRKGKLVKKSLILPLTLAAGNYYIIGYVDEAGVNDDKDTSNNTKSSTKAIQVL